MNLKGGYKIISLMAITLIAGAVGDDRTAITDEGILNQLDSLKEYLDESKQLKPILLRVKDSGNEVVMANLSKKTGEGIFYINADLVDASLNIMVKFAQDEETLEYYIDEAGYLYIADVDKVAGEVAKAEDGTIVKVLGLDADGGLVKGTISGGTKLYKHVITLSDFVFESTPLIFITNFSQPLTYIEELSQTNKGVIISKYILDNGYYNDILRLGIDGYSKFAILVNDSHYFNTDLTLTSEDDVSQITFTDTVTEL